MEALLSHFSETHRILAYVILFFIVFLIEGEITLVLAGVLSRHHYLTLLNVIGIGFIAAVLHDLLYWSLGVRLGRTNRKKLWFVDIEKARGFLEGLRNRYGISIFLSKFAWGINKPVLVATGYMNLPLKELLRYGVPTCLVWVISLSLLGYGFASKTDLLRRNLQAGSLLILLLLAALFILQSGVRKILKGSGR